MIRSLYTAVSGLITQEAKQDVITNNLANVNTVGFKGDNLAVKSFKDVLIQNYDKILNGKNVRSDIGYLSQGSQIDGTKTSFTQGTIEDTDNWTDFALDGGGFFTVQRQTDNSNANYYTRDGQFHVNSQGYLVNSSEDKVLGIRVDYNGQRVGAALPIKMGTQDIKLSGDGTFTLNGERYKFNTVDFQNYDSLQKVGDNLYFGENPIAENAAVKQNSLEKSNVNVMNEMVNMISTMRIFESNQKVVQSIDETLGKAVNEVGSVK